MTQDSSADRVLLYLHIPKTAGTTLTSCIYDGCCAPDYYQAENGRLHSGVYYYPKNFHKDADPLHPEEVLRAIRRPDVRAIVGHFPFGIHQALARPATYITVLRNPVDRLMSLFHHITTFDNHEWHQDVVSKGMSIETFIDTYRCRETDNDQTRRISGMEPPFGECTTEMLEQAKVNLARHFTVVGLTERFDETLVLVRRAFGWSQDAAYWPRLVNKKRPSSAGLPASSLDAILSRNQLDLDLYSYACELFESLIQEQPPGFQKEVETLVETKHSVLNKGNAQAGPPFLSLSSSPTS